jgi:hypothetical protein
MPVFPTLGRLRVMANLSYIGKPRLKKKKKIRKEKQRMGVLF